MASPTVEYVRPDELDLRTLARLLPFPLHAGAEQTVGGARAFYDTFDGRLRAERMRLVHEDGELKLVRRDGRELAAAPCAEPPGTLDPSALAPQLRSRVAPVCDVRVLLRIAEIDSERRQLAIVDDEEKTVARLVAEHAVVRDSPRAGDTLRPRLHLIGVRGYDDAFNDVRNALERQLGLSPATETFDDELRARSQSSPAGLSSDGHEGLTADLPSDRAAVALCTNLLHVIEANLPGTLANLDSEFLHDFRVAVRRTRSLLRELKTAFPPTELDHFRTEFKWLQQVTGPSRDLDVYLLEFDDFTNLVPPALQPDLLELRAVLEQRHVSEREAMERELRSDRAAAVFADWADFLEGLPGMSVDERPDAVTPIGDLAARRIDRVYRQMVKMGKAIGDDSPHEDLHELRKKGKELRYLLEFFSPLFSRKVTKPMVRTLKSLQDTLGRFQDREVQAHMIHGLADELGGEAKSGPTLMAMGVLIERLTEQQDEARAEFSERFAAFASSEQRALVKKTFG